jgi:mannitol-1-/sugar-/sorbitol-6-/2-deoxyglucose-6-phosphatase
MVERIGLSAAIFDMDGLLVDTEPLWRKAEVEVFGALGVPLTDALAHTTTGLRVDEVVAHWRARHPWDGPGNTQVADDILDAVSALIVREGKLLPGVEATLELVGAAGLRVGLASSSPMRLIETVLGHFALRTHFRSCFSAEHEPYGKPHPAVYLRAAAALEAAPTACLAFEDSFNGLLAAKSARMQCVLVPAPEARGDKRWGIADVVLDSLADFELY